MVKWDKFIIFFIFMKKEFQENTPWEEQILNKKDTFSILWEYISSKVLDIVSNTKNFDNSSIYNQNIPYWDWVIIEDFWYDNRDNNEYEKKLNDFQEKYNNNREKQTDFSVLYNYLYNLQTQWIDIINNEKLVEEIINFYIWEYHYKKNKRTVLSQIEHIIECYAYSVELWLEFLFTSNFYKPIELIGRTNNFKIILELLKQFKDNGLWNNDLIELLAHSQKINDIRGKKYVIDKLKWVVKLFLRCKELYWNEYNRIFSILSNQKNGSNIIEWIHDFYLQTGHLVSLWSIYSILKKTDNIWFINKIIFNKYLQSAFQIEKQLHEEYPTLSKNSEVTKELVVMRLKNREFFGANHLAKFKWINTLNITNLLKLSLNTDKASDILIGLYDANIKGVWYNDNNSDIIALLFWILWFLEDKIPEDIKVGITDLVSNNKDKIYSKIKKYYSEFLNSWKWTDDMRVFCKSVKSFWLWNLSQAQTLTNFLSVLNEKGNPKINELLQSFEEKNSKLSNQEKTHFYNISIDILKVSPKLLESYWELMALLDQEQTKYFLENLYTLHNVLINFALLSWKKFWVFNEFKKEVIWKLLKDCKNWNITEVLEKNKKEIQDKIILKAKNKSWIIKIPEIFSEEAIENIKQFSIYYTNIHARNKEKTKMIWMALWLKLNWSWEKFRSLEEINFNEYFEPETAGFAWEYKTKLIELFSKNWLQSKELKILQESMSNIMIWTAETIDQKLINIKNHITNQLTDRDAYSEEMYKIFELYKKYWKDFWKALALKFQSFTKNITFDKTTIEILSQLWELRSTQQVKQIQEQIDVVKWVIWINEDLTKIDLETPIKEWNELLIPNQEIINIFSRLWENFSSNSWVIALSQDVSYLTDLVWKDRQKQGNERILSKQEYELALNYLNSIKTKLDSLYKYLFDLEEIFKNRFCEKDKNWKDWEKKELVVKKLYEKEELLKSRIEDLKNEILKSQNKDSWTIEMMTTMTSSLTDVIANIRWCLWCQKKECNNDTNLRFTAPNEFFIMSKKIWSQKSFTDQPVTLLESNNWLVFILDTLRGETKTADILIAHILVLLKKIKQTKRKDIQVLFPANASGGVWITAEYMRKRIKEEIDDKIEVQDNFQFNIKIPNQDFYDPYYEWWHGRYKKDAIVSGIMIKLG